MGKGNYNQRLNGLNPLSYMGVNAYQPPEFVTDNRPPTINDSLNFELGTIWLDEGTHNPPTANDIYMLVALFAGRSTWVPLSGGSGTVTSVNGGNNITITGTATDPIVNVSGTINHSVLLGNATDSINSLANGTTGQALIAQTGADPIWGSVALTGAVTEFTLDDASVVTPSVGNINLGGVSNIQTLSPGSSTIHISLAGITQHSVQIGGAAETLTQLANGTTGQVLTAQTGADPIWAASTSGALVLIQTQTAASVTSLPFTTGITSTYNNYLLISDSAISPLSSAGILLLQISTNGGSSYIASGYFNTSGPANGLYLTNSTFTSTNYHYVTSNIYNATSGAVYIGCFSDGTYASSTAAGSISPVSSSYGTASTIMNAFQLVISDGSAFSGTFSLYGYNK
jgi:hypothetical protein